MGIRRSVEAAVVPPADYSMLDGFRICLFCCSLKAVSSLTGSEDTRRRLLF